MAIERLFLPFQKTDRRQSRAGTLDGLFEKGWQQNRRREQANETKRKELDNTVDEQHEQHQEKKVRKKENEPDSEEEEQKKSKKAKKVKKVSPKKSKHRRQQQPPEQVPPPLDYKDFIHALTRWSSIRQSPNQVVQEVDSLLSLLSPSITCQTGCYVAVNVSSLKKNRLVFVQVNTVHNLFHLSCLTHSFFYCSQYF